MKHITKSIKQYKGYIFIYTGRGFIVDEYSVYDPEGNYRGLTLSPTQWLITNS